MQIETALNVGYSSVGGWETGWWVHAGFTAG